MLFKRDIKEAERIPLGWGVCYRDFDRNCKIAYPLPFNIILRWTRDFRFWLMSVGRPGYKEKVEHAAYIAGHKSAETANSNYIRHILNQQDEAWMRGYVAGCAQASGEDK